MLAVVCAFDWGELIQQGTDGGPRRITGSGCGGCFDGLAEHGRIADRAQQSLDWNQ